MDSFTTQPSLKGYIKRGSFIIRNRCLDFIEPMQKAGIKELPIEEAIEAFGIHDRATIKAYFGTLPSRSCRLIHRTARYATGTMSMKTITLEQPILKTRGYLEKLGLVHYERRGSHWFMVLENPILVPTLKNMCETPSETSLSHPIPILVSAEPDSSVLKGSDFREHPNRETAEITVNNDIHTHTHCRVRERNQSSESERSCFGKLNCDIGTIGASCGDFQACRERFQHG